MNLLRQITGTVVAATEAALLLRAGPLTFSILPTVGLLSRARVGEEMEVEVHLRVREDALELFGFASGAERELFELLLEVKGVGPRVAVELLALGEQAVRAAISGGDSALLATARGVGKRVASRITMELQEKISQLPNESAPSPTAAEPSASAHVRAAAVLQNLGWKGAQVNEALRNAPKELATDEEQLVRWFLRGKGAG